MKLAHNYYVYIVRCKGGLYYTGITNDLDRRLQEHNNGFDPKCFTYRRRPVELMYFEHFIDVNQAISWEKQLKGWSRKKKEALIAGDISSLKKFSKSKSHPSSSSG